MAAGFRSALLFSLMAAVSTPAPAAIELKLGFARAERAHSRADKKPVTEPHRRDKELKRLATRAIEQIVVLGELDLVVQDGIWFSQGLDIADLFLELFGGRD